MGKKVATRVTEAEVSNKNLFEKKYSEKISAQLTFSG
jgi:hypothetical protein